jgi:hypothetical protein
MCLLQVRRAGLMEALSSKLAAGRILIVDELVLGVAGAEFALRKALHANMAAIKDFDNPRPVVGNKKPGVFRQRVYAAIGGDRRVFGIPSSGLLYPDDEIVDNIMKRVRANGVDAAELLYRTSALRAIECFVPQIFVHRTFIPTMSRTSALQGFCGTLASLQLRLADEQGRFDVAEILYRTNVPPIIKLDIVEFLFITDAVPSFGLWLPFHLPHIGFEAHLCLPFQHQLLAICPTLGLCRTHVPLALSWH